MSELICKKGDNKANRDYNKGAIPGSISTTTSAESTTNLNPAILTKLLHDDTRSSSTDQVDLELNEIEKRRSMLRSSPTDKVATDTASSEGKYLLSYVLTLF